MEFLYLAENVRLLYTNETLVAILHQRHNTGLCDLLRGAQGNSANGNCEKNGRKNENHSKTSGSRQRKLKYCQFKILLFINVFLKFYIFLQIQFGILLFFRQNMH